MKTAIILFAHGSRVESANEGVRDVAAALARAGEFSRVQAAFLELGRPNLEDAVTALAAEGVDRVIVVPYFLTLGTHMERDLPRLIADISQKNNGLAVITAAPLEGHPGLVDILMDRVRQV